MDDKAPSRLHDRRLWGGLLLLVGLLGAVAASVGWYLARQPRLPEIEPVPLTDLNPYGANFFLDREVEHWKQEKTLEMASEAGIGWMKQQFSWEEIEPLRKGEYDWVKYDRIVDLAERYGLQLIARLDRPPDWTRAGSSIKTQPPDDLADYGDFVYAFVDRYRGRVRYIQIWNEPNLSAEWGFQRVDAVAYTQLLEVAYRRAKDADPNVVVLSAPLAITLEDASMRGNHNDLIFLEQMYEAGAGSWFDVLSANAFGLDKPPDDPPAPDALNFRRTELHREIMERFGDGAKPVWINEYGWNAAPESFAEELLTWERVSPEQQADYTVQGIAWGREHWPWLGVVNIWYFRQVGNVPPDRAAYYFALVDPEFNTQPVYDSVQQASEGTGRAGPGLHQETSAAVSARDWPSALDPGASAGGALVGRVGVEPLSFSFEGTSVALVTTRDADQGRALVEIDGGPAKGLRPDDQGRSYVELQGNSPKVQSVVTLARGLEEGTHRLSLVPQGPGEVTVDGFLVTEEAGLLLFYGLWLVCGLVAVAGVALWATGTVSAPKGS